MQLDLAKGSRSRVLAGVLLLIMAVFVARLFYLQIVQHEYYVAQASSEQQKQLRLPAQRGEIYMMSAGKPEKVVLNETVYTVFADPKMVTDQKKVITAVQRIAGGNADDGLDRRLEKKDSRYQVLARKVSLRQAELLKKEKLTGVGFQKESQRVYPEGSLAAQTLGFVNAEGKGQYGVESKLNERLVGKDGLLKTVTDVSGIPLTIGNNNVAQSAKNGDNVVLTLDRNIQAYTEKALQDGLNRTGAKQGSALVMDPQTGKVLAMANLPTYRPAEYYKVREEHAFVNSVVSAPYEAGSVMKTMTMATGLDKGVIQPDSTYVNTDEIQVDDRTIGNATKGQLGTITMQHALSWSLNTGLVTVAQRLGNGNSITYGARSTMYDYLVNRFGYGKPTGIEVAGEESGTVISPDRPQGNAVRYANMSFGQGMDVTMIQVGAAFSALMNGGTYYQPTVLAGTMNDGQFQPAPSKQPRNGVVSEATSNKIRTMTRTARQLFASNRDKDRPGYDIGGKTGTSQTIVNGQYSNDQTIATYLGYGGDNRPRYVIMVQVSGRGMYLEGAEAAMPIFTDISNWMIDYLKLQPRG